MEKLQIRPEEPVFTDQLRQAPLTRPIYEQADLLGELPSVKILPSTDPDARRTPSVQALAIEREGVEVGKFNLVQTPNRSWINDINIEKERRGEHLAVAAYVGLIAINKLIGRDIESDPQGLSEDSLRIWQSLEKRGVAQTVEGDFDAHGNPRYTSKLAGYN